MMYGLDYDMICPFCGKKFSASHGITLYYNIKGYAPIDPELGRFLVEYCNKCDTAFYSDGKNFIKVADVNKQDVKDAGAIMW